MRDLKPCPKQRRRLQGENDPVNPDAWLGKAEAAEFLGVSVRQIEYRAARGEIRKRTMPKERHERAARIVYSREDLAAIRAGEVKNTARWLFQPSPHLAAGVARFLALPRPLIDALRERREPAAAARPWLSLADAAEYSGLPTFFLLLQARRGAAWALNVGQGSKAHWRFNRDALADLHSS